MDTLSFEEKLSKLFVKSLGSKINLSELEQAKVEYGFSVLFINLLKLLIIYIISIFLNSLIQTIIIHSSFCLLRKYSYGFHAKKSVNCTLIGMVCFAIIPWLINWAKLEISLYGLILISVICSVILYRYAPADTLKRIIKFEQKKELRKNTLKILFTITTVLAFCNNTVKLLGITGVFIATVFTLPLKDIGGFNNGN